MAEDEVGSSADEPVESGALEDDPEERQPARTRDEPVESGAVEEE